MYRAINLNDQRTQAGTNYGGTGWYGYSSSSYPLRPQILKLPPGGSAWMIADVSRCVRLNGIAREDRSPRTRFTVQTGTATLQTIELTPANAHTAWSSLSLSGVNAIRITMTNLDPATPSSGSFTADLTCAR